MYLQGPKRLLMHVLKKINKECLQTLCDAAVRNMVRLWAEHVRLWYVYIPWSTRGMENNRLWAVISKYACVICSPYMYHMETIVLQCGGIEV